MAQVFPLPPVHTDLGPQAVERRAAGRFWRRLLVGLRAPDPGIKPADLHVPSRVWRRNSALLMSFYQHNGNE